eukprot:14000052-Alexandrium_andersonii.AAC.1
MWQANGVKGAIAQVRGLMCSTPPRACADVGCTDDRRPPPAQAASCRNTARVRRRNTVAIQSAGASTAPMLGL